MKLFCVCIASILISQYCNAAPQRLEGLDSEVELVPATNTNERDPESGFPLRGNGGSVGSGFPVIIVRTSSAGRNPLHTLLNDFFGKSGTTNEETPIEEEDIPEIPLSNFPDLSSILGIKNKDTSETDVSTDENIFPDFPSIFSKGTTNTEKKCGLLCTLFKNFDTQLKTIEEEVREIRDREREKENEIDQGDEQESSGPVNEYTEEVLPDGTVVRTNKTYSTSEDGTSFFSFQSTSFNSFGDSTKTKTDEEIDEGANQDDEVATDTVSDNDSPQKEYEDEEEQREELEDNIPVTIETENKRSARSANDPFDQQQEDVSAFLLKGSKPFKQEKHILSSQNPQDNEISNNPLRTRGGIPVYPPVSLDGDTLVNDLLLENGRRGGLVRLEPDAELLKQEATEY